MKNRRKDFLRSLSISLGLAGLLSCSDGPVGPDPKSDPDPTPVDTTHVNSAPSITSNPLIQVNENWFYEYQVTATDPDGDRLAYSLIQSPNWLTVNSSTGLISGIAPEVNADTGFNVGVRVSDGAKTDTQLYGLAVRDIPPRIISQTMNLVNLIDISNVITLTNVDTAFRKLFYNDSLISTDTITNGNFTQMLEDRLIGEWRSVLEADTLKPDTASVIIPLYSVPAPNTSQITFNVNEDGSTSFSIPRPVAINPELNPVIYTSAVSRNGRVVPSLGAFPIDTIVGINALSNPGQDIVELIYQGNTQPIAIPGEVINLPDLSGQVQSVVTRMGGLASLYAHTIVGIDTLFLDSVITDTQGNFDFRLKEPVSNIFLQSRLETGIVESNYIRTLVLGGGDTTNLLIRAFPYNPLLAAEGVNRIMLRAHAEELSPQNQKTYVDSLELIADDPLGGGPLSSDFMNLVELKTLDPNDIGCYRPFGEIYVQKDFLGMPDSATNYDVRPSGDGYRIFADSGWIAASRDTTLRNLDGVTGRINGGYGFDIRLKNESVGLAAHEIGRVFLGLSEVSTLTSSQTIMTTVFSGDKPRLADCQIAYIRGEPTWPEFTPYDRILGLNLLPRQ